MGRPCAPVEMPARARCTSDVGYVIWSSSAGSRCVHPVPCRLRSSIAVPRMCGCRNSWRSSRDRFAGIRRSVARRRVDRATMPATPAQMGVGKFYWKAKRQSILMLLSSGSVARPSVFDVRPTPSIARSVRRRILRSRSRSFKAQSQDNLSFERAIDRIDEKAKVNGSQLLEVPGRPNRDRPRCRVRPLDEGRHPQTARRSPRITRVVFNKPLKAVRLIRNDAMHFDPDRIDEQELTKLRQFCKLLDQIQWGAKLGKYLTPQVSKR